MPKSKRSKKVPLSRLATKGLNGKQKKVLDLRTCVEKYTSIYTYTVFNVRNVQMKLVREEWKPSRFVFGKINIMILALGKHKDTEVAPDLHKLTHRIKGPGQCGLLFTDCTKEEVVDWFKNFSISEYARAGFKVSQTIELNQGPLKQFPHSMEPYLRETLGLPTKLDKGVITLIRDFQVCKAGDLLTPEQARILELFEHKLTSFHFKLKAMWTKLDGYESLSEHDDGDEEAENNDDGDDGMDDDDDGDN